MVELRKWSVETWNHETVVRSRRQRPSNMAHPRTSTASSSLVLAACNLELVFDSMSVEQAMPGQPRPIRRRDAHAPQSNQEEYPALPCGAEDGGTEGRPELIE
jgi:hypothetical protein